MVLFEILKSTKMGREAISKVVLCRILMASSSMVFPPVVLDYLSKQNRLLARKPKLYLPLQVTSWSIYIFIYLFTVGHINWIGINRGDSSNVCNLASNANRFR